jgi:isopentenyl-diphosphate delta-isomerase
MRIHDGDVIVVDHQNRVIGSCAKLSAHQAGVLHRAVSVFIVSPGCDHLLLQKRADGKYHSGGLWSNTACSHPAPGESVAAAARRCLRTEMGLSARLRPAHVFQYLADVGTGLLENEIDHVFWGATAKVPSPAPDEVADWKWENVEAVLEDIQANPDRFTVWFRLCCATTINAILSGTNTSQS